MEAIGYQPRQENEQQRLSAQEILQLPHLVPKEQLEIKDYLPQFEIGRKINKIAANPAAEKLPNNWYELPGTGFSMKKAMDLLPQDWSPQEFQTWLEQTRSDVQGFVLEYLARRGVFPLQFTTHHDREKPYLRAPFYGNKVMRDTIMSEERHGLLKAAWEDTEDFLTDPKTEDGTCRVVISPEGPSSIFTINDDGSETIFPDSQRYVLEKRGDTIVGFTIRTSADYETEAAFIQKMTGDTIPKGSSPEAYVAKVITVLPGQLPGGNIEGIVKVMQSVHKDKATAYYDKKHPDHKVSWDEIFRDLKREDLWSFPGDTKLIYDEFVRFAKLFATQDDTPETMLLIKEALAVTILDMSNYLKGTEEQEHARRYTSNEYTQSRPLVAPQTYGSALETVQQAVGCNGGGSTKGGLPSATVIIESMSPRVVEKTLDEIINGENDYLNDPELCRCENQSAHFHCPHDVATDEGIKKCGFALIVPVGNKSCPGCGGDKTCG